MYSQRDCRIAPAKASAEHFTIHELDCAVQRSSRRAVKKRNEWLADAQILYFYIFYFFSKARQKAWNVGSNFYVAFDIYISF